MAEFPPLVLIVVALATLFSIAAAIKAVWHNCQLRRGGERPLGMFSQLRNSKGDRP
jgi:hypothetical protein